MAFVTDINRPQPLWQPPPTACLTASEAASEVPFPSNASMGRRPQTRGMPGKGGGGGWTVMGHVGGEGGMDMGLRDDQRGSLCGPLFKGSGGASGSGGGPAPAPPLRAFMCCSPPCHGPPGLAVPGPRRRCKPPRLHCEAQRSTAGGRPALCRGLGRPQTCCPAPSRTWHTLFKGRGGAVHRRCDESRGAYLVRHRPCPLLRVRGSQALGKGVHRASTRSLCVSHRYEGPASPAAAVAPSFHGIARGHPPPPCATRTSQGEGGGDPATIQHVHTTPPPVWHTQRPRRTAIPCKAQGDGRVQRGRKALRHGASAVHCGAAQCTAVWTAGR